MTFYIKFIFIRKITILNEYELNGSNIQHIVHFKLLYLTKQFLKCIPNHSIITLLSTFANIIKKNTVCGACVKVSTLKYKDTRLIKQNLEKYWELWSYILSSEMAEIFWNSNAV